MCKVSYPWYDNVQIYALTASCCIYIKANTGVYKGPVISYIEGRGKKRGSQGYLRWGRWGGGGAKRFYNEV